MNGSDTNNGLVFLRPKTRGELYYALKAGFKCECVTSNVEFTSLALQSLNAMGCGDVKFKTYPSENAGWSIYEPITNKDCLCKTKSVPVPDNTGRNRCKNCGLPV